MSRDERQNLYQDGGETGGAGDVDASRPRLWANTISLVDDFNDWDRALHPLRRDREGKWRLPVDLLLGRAYQFRSLRDGAWMGDNQADAPMHHASNSDNFVVVTDPNVRGIQR